MPPHYSGESPIQKVLACLPNAKQVKDGWLDCCPAHDDHNPSLSIKEAENRDVLLICRSNGCETTDIVAKIGLQMRDLFWQPNSGRTSPARRSDSPRSIPDKPTGPSFPTHEAAIKSYRLGKPSAVWEYHDHTAQTVGYVARWDRPDGKKEIRPVTRHDNQWSLESMPEPRPLYRLTDLADADTVFVCEGEKAADAIRSLGLVATTSSGGSGAPSKTDWSPLAGKLVVLLPDNDEPGRKFAAWVIHHLATLSQPPTVKIVTLPTLPHAGDAVDWIESRDSQTTEELRETLMEMVLQASPIESRPIQFAQHFAEKGMEVPQGLITVNLADVEPREVSWLWSGRIPLGKITLIGGDPGLGKSTMTMDITARVTRGDGWPDDREYRTAPAKVILFNSEDDIADTIRPRLDKAGAIIENVIVVQGVPHLDSEGKPVARGFDLSRDLARLTRELEGTPSVRLVVIDPISAYCGKVDSHNNTDVRGMLAPLADLAAKHSAAILLVTHLSKGSTQSRAVYRAMGSLAFAAAARAVWAVEKDPEDPERRLWVPVKFNCGPMPSGLAYRSAGHIIWDDQPVLQSADELLCGDGKSSKTMQEDPASRWLIDFLDDGPQASTEVFTQSEACGFSRSQINRAKTKLGISPRKEGFEKGKWIWELPENRHTSVKSPFFEPLEDVQN